MFAMPFGAFLAGSLLTLLLPVCLLLALAGWYWKFTMRVPETPTVSHPPSEPQEATPAPHIPEPLPADPAT